MEVIEEAPDEGSEAHQSRVADRPVIGLELFHQEHHSSAYERRAIVPEQSITEDKFHDVQGMDLGVFALSGLLHLLQQKLQCSIQQLCLLAFPFHAWFLVVGSVCLDYGWFGPKYRKNGWRDTCRTS